MFIGISVNEISALETLPLTVTEKMWSIKTEVTKYTDEFRWYNMKTKNNINEEAIRSSPSLYIKP